MLVPILIGAFPTKSSPAIARLRSPEEIIRILKPNVKEDEIKQEDVQLASIAEGQQASIPQQAPSLQSVMGNLNQMEVLNGQI